MWKLSKFWTQLCSAPPSQYVRRAASFAVHLLGHGAIAGLAGIAAIFVAYHAVTLSVKQTMTAEREAQETRDQEAVLGLMTVVRVDCDTWQANNTDDRRFVNLEQPLQMPTIGLATLLQNGLLLARISPEHLTKLAANLSNLSVVRDRHLAILTRANAIESNLEQQSSPARIRPMPQILPPAARGGAPTISIPTRLPDNVLDEIRKQTEEGRLRLLKPHIDESSKLVAEYRKNMDEFCSTIDASKQHLSSEIAEKRKK